MQDKSFIPAEYPNAGYQKRPSTEKGKTDSGKPVSSGINQPHNAKKEALGPNTNR